MIPDKYLIKIFKAIPSQSLLLLPDAPQFTIKEVSAAYLKATGAREGDLINKGIFEVFPGNPNAVQSLSASFEKVLKTKQSDKIAAQCYDIPICNTQDSIEKSERLENVPILNEDGEVVYILHSLIHVTDMDNLTERKLAETRIKQSEAHLAEAQRLAKIGSWNFDLKANRLSWSEELYNVFGADKQTFIETHGSFIDLIDAEDRDLVRQTSRHTQETGEPFTIEYHVTTPKKERKIIQEHGYGEMDAHGKVIRLFGTAQDITDYRLAEEALHLSDKLYGLVTKATNDSIWDWDLLKNEVLRPGKKLENMFGYPDIGASEVDAFWRTHVHPEDWTAMTKNRKILFENPEENFWEGEYRFIKPDGQYAYVHDRGYIIRNKEGKAIRMIGASRNITREKEHISELKRSEKRYSELFHICPEPLWVYEMETLRFIQVNKVAIENYGYSEEEFLNMTVMDIRPAEDIERVKEIVNKQKEEHAGIHKVNARHCKKTGEIIDIEISTAPIVINGKECRLAIAVDITEKNLFELRLTKAIIKTQEDERYEIGSELHDNVCQLLALARLNLGMLKNSLTQSEIVWFDRCNENIVLASDETRNLSHRLAPSFFDNTTLEETFSRLLTTFNTTGRYEIVLQLEDPVYSYPLSHEIQLNLYRILQEQLRNILNYANASLIEINVLIQNNKLKMSISDNGIGFHVGAVNNGIGFANMKRRAELFLGHLKIESSPGNGCKIIVEIPLS
jgi:PAS domain S-box-containing protein